MAEVNIYTDISLEPTKGGISCFAFRIVSEQFVLSKVGILKSTEGKTTDDEMKCIANALYTLVVTPEFYNRKDKDVKVIVHTDSKHVVDLLNGNSGISKRNKDSRVLLHEIQTLSLELGVEKLGLSVRDSLLGSLVKVELVKGHTGLKDVHSVNNHWCDVEARNLLRGMNKERMQSDTLNFS